MKSEDIDKIIEEALAEKKGKGKERKRKTPKSGYNQLQLWRRILNTLFLIGAAATVIVFFVIPENKPLFYSLGFGSMAVKIIEFIIRFVL